MHVDENENKKETAKAGNNFNKDECTCNCFEAGFEMLVARSSLYANLFSKTNELGGV